jgi:hypothetical protein
VNPDIYLSSDVPFIEKMWSSMLETKHSWNKPNSKMALLYIGAALFSDGLHKPHY